jgi:A/G-specific adenine glycosylase
MEAHRDPYHILVSEVMLPADAGRSRPAEVPRVGWRNIRRSTRSPTRQSIEVADTWRPARLHIRPRRLHAIARESVERFGGTLPSDEETLLSFKGIGAYTAGAIRSFAFGERAAILDTNVARVLFRVFVNSGDRKAHATVKHLWNVSEALVPRKHVFDFNQALMDLGAMVCTARNPKCLVCPMARQCKSYPMT